MNLLDKPVKIKRSLSLPLNISESGWYLVSVSARVKSEKQRGENETDDEDLRVEIDGQKFPKLDNPTGLLDSPAAFSGGRLHNLLKTIYFILWLEKGEHTTSLIPDESALIEAVTAFKLDDTGEIKLDLDLRAEDGDRRPWITFTLVDLPLSLFRITAATKKRYRDSDDLKIIIDGETKTHFEPEDESPPDPKPLEWFYRFWYFAGSILLGEVTSYSLKTNLPQGLHYLELHADRMPTLKSIEFDFGGAPQEPPKIRKYQDDKFGRDYNQLDQYILNAVSFWNDFFLKQEYPPPEPLDPNLVKAIIYRESNLGYYPDESIIDVMQVWDPENPAKPTLLGETPESEFITPDEIGYMSYSYPEDKTPLKVGSREESIFWGVRWLYHKAQYLQTVPDSETELVTPYVREWRSWEGAIGKYNANEEIVEEYIEEVFMVYEKGVDPEGNVLWEK